MGVPQNEKGTAAVIYPGAADWVVIGNKNVKVKVGHRGVAVGCHYVTDEAFERELYR